MSFTYTTNYSIPKPDVNTEIDTWGDDLNAGADIIDGKIKLATDAAAAASTLADTKAPLVHVHAGADITSGTVAAARMPAFTGDVTSAVGTVANVIPAGSIANAKLANMAANTIKGTIAGGVPTDLTGANVLTITGAATAASVTAAITTEVGNARTGSYTLVAADAGKMVTFDSGSGVTCTVNSSVFAAGNRVDILQLDIGQVTFAGSATRRASGAKSKLAGQYSAATIWFISASEYVLIGDIAT